MTLLFPVQKSFFYVFAYFYILFYFLFLLVLSVEHPINYFDFTDQEAKSIGIITCDEEFSVWSLESVKNKNKNKNKNIFSHKKQGQNKQQLVPHLYVPYFNIVVI